MKSISATSPTQNVHEGGCPCRAVRTGSAFGIGAYFRENDVEIVKDDGLKTYRRTSDDPKRARFNN